ncbi:MAG: energy-coupling factor ABC transporter ATP-binding protein, partial [Leucobacter sp.]
ALEDIALSLRRTHRGKRERAAAARAALERFGLGGLAERSVHALSGGQKQLLAIASVLATDPAILVADEPTTLLDLRNARMIGELLLSLPQQVVLVTHDLELAARADRTLVIDGGRVVFDGAPAEAVAHYRALSGEPVAGSGDGSADPAPPPGELP